MVQVAPSRITRQRPDTLERWHKALERALDQGLEVFIVADTGERLVTSASKLDTLHRTDGRGCTCEAALSGDPVCMHRAVVRSILGWLPALPAARPCIWCNGCGKVEDLHNQRYRPCDVCGGTGVRADLRPKATPAVQPVAAA